MNEDRVRDLIGDIAKRGERIPMNRSAADVRQGVNRIVLDETHTAQRGRPGLPGWRRRLGLAASIAVLVAVAVPITAAVVFVALPLSTHSHSQAAATTTTSPSLSTTTTPPPSDDRGTSGAQIAVGRAVGNTDAAANFDLSFTLTGGSNLDTQGLSSAGSADLTPTFAMTLNDVVGASLFFGQDNAWEQLGSQLNEFTLPGFSTFAENSVGTIAGALSTFAFCSPTGLFDLTQNEIGPTTLVGPATVNGVSTTEYAVAIDPTTFLDAPGITSGERQAMQAAISVLNGGTIAENVYIDSAGDVVQTVSSIDGATFQVDLSNFGNAGTVTLPPQQTTINSNTNPVTDTTPCTGTPSGSISTSTTMGNYSEPPTTVTTGQCVASSGSASSGNTVNNGSVNSTTTTTPGGG